MGKKVIEYQYSQEELILIETNKKILLQFIAANSNNVHSETPYSITFLAAKETVTFPLILKKFKEILNHEASSLNKRGYNYNLI